MEFTVVKEHFQNNKGSNCYFQSASEFLNKWTITWQKIQRKMQIFQNTSLDIQFTFVVQTTVQNLNIFNLV